MFEELFEKASAVVHHKAAPHAAERERFLAHCAQEGFSQASLKRMAATLLAVAHELRDCPDLQGGTEHIQAAATRAAHLHRKYAHAGGARQYRKRFVREARRWLRFLGRFREPALTAPPFGGLIEDFATWMEHERGLSAPTIHLRRQHIEPFLRWFAKKRRPLSSVRLADVDAFLAARQARGVSRVTVKIQADAIRSFLRHAGSRGWCSPSLADAIDGPRIYTHETLPSGPSWAEVGRLLSSLETERPLDIRDRAIIRLFAIYGLRAHEVARLRLEDIDWAHDRISVPRSKQRRSQLYPLTPAVGHAIIRYLKEARPPCAYRELFVTSRAPLRPMSSGSLYQVVAARLHRLGIQSPHYGPHALRHACATHLVAQGFSLKEIGDHLGHRSPAATRIYAKVDLPGLREVAAFDLGELR